MTRTREIIISTLVSSAMMVQGLAFLTHPKISMERPDTGFKLQAPVPPLQDEGSVPQALSLRVEPEADTPDAVSDVKKEETLPLELLGTAMGNTKDPIAFIKDLESGKQSMYRAGSKVRDARVFSIALGEVVLERNGVKVTLKMSKRARSWAGMSESGLIISKTDTMVTVSRKGLLQESARILNALPALKFKPYFEGKKAAGLMVDGIDEKSIVKETGIQNKDIIKTVNGQPINTYQQALQVASKMRNAPEIAVSILRDGRLQNLSYRIAP